MKKLELWYKDNRILV